jgi:hypothetical protein
MVSWFSFNKSWIFNTIMKNNFKFVYVMKWIVQNNLRRCRVGITDGIYDVPGRGGLRWHDIYACLRKKLFRHLTFVEDINVDTHMHSRTHTHSKVIS